MYLLIRTLVHRINPVRLNKQNKLLENNHDVI